MMTRPLLLFFFAFACVPGVALEDAPCPCGAGYDCCSTLGVCLPASAICPETLPPSSNTACETDDACGWGEVCASWQKSDGAIAGPRVCKKSCNVSACSEGERCLYSLHGARPVADLAITALCLPAAPSAECAPWICEGCPGLDLGASTSCRNGETEIFGCVFALHPECGLKCELTKLGECVGIAPPCQAYACDECPGLPGEVECSAGKLITCLGARTELECGQLCARVEVGSCE